MRGLYPIIYLLGLSRNSLPLQNSEINFHGILTLSWIRWLHFVPGTLLILYITVHIPIYSLISQVVSRPSISLIKIFCVFLICLHLIPLRLTAVVTSEEYKLWSYPLCRIALFWTVTWWVMVMNYHYSTCNSPEDFGSHPLGGGSLASHVLIL